MLPSGQITCKKCGKSFSPEEIELRMDRCLPDFELQKFSLDMFLACPDCKVDSRNMFVGRFVNVPSEYVAVKGR